MDDQLFEIQAADSQGTVTDIKFTFNVDITGPVISNPQPVPGAIVGQVIRLAANITDAAGLDTSSIQVLIGDKTNPQFKLPLTVDSTGAFSTLFDSRLLTSCKLPPSTALCIVRPTVSFRAADALGNETTLSYEIALDNIPPIADLTPPPVRSTKLDSGVRCSFAYDPLSQNLFSGDAPDDGCRVPQMFDLRARVEDDGNSAAGEKGVPISEVDPNVTAAYVLAETDQPLVVDIDGDGNCDVINPKLVPTTSPLMPMAGTRQVLKIRMRPVPPAGVADYREDLSIPATLPCVPGSDLNRRSCPRSGPSSPSRPTTRRTASAASSTRWPTTCPRPAGAASPWRPATRTATSARRCPSACGSTTPTRARPTGATSRRPPRAPCRAARALTTRRPTR
jgi:hypothetical protein